MRLIALGLFVCALGCDGRAPRDAAPTGDAWVRQVDETGARLLATAARVRTWREMADRHRTVSALACTGQEAHAMALREQRERVHGRAKATRARRQAAAARPAETPTPN